MQQIVTGLEQLGLALYGEFITASEELELIPKLLAPVKFGYKDTAGRSTIQRYGDPRVYCNHIVSATIPAHFVALGARLCEHKLRSTPPLSITVNEYLPGDSIRAHIDEPSAGKVITVLSLGSPGTMLFKRKGVPDEHAVVLPPRSVVQMRDEIRLAWTHEILPVEAHRYSVVFRGWKDEHDA
jgi:alkylated DNA repair dioxygenase AlkB